MREIADGLEVRAPILVSAVIRIQKKRAVWIYHPENLHQGVGARVSGSACDRYASIAAGGITTADRDVRIERAVDHGVFRSR